MAETQTNPISGRGAKDAGMSPSSDWDRPQRESSLGKGPGDSDMAKCSTGEQLKEQASAAMETAKDLADEAKTKVQEVVQVGSEKAQQMKTAAGQQMHTVAEKIRQGGEVASEKADQIGTYLQDHDFGAIGQDVTEIVRRYPVQALLVGIGLGILLGRAGR